MSLLKSAAVRSPLDTRLVSKTRGVTKDRVRYSDEMAVISPRHIASHQNTLALVSAGVEGADLLVRRSPRHNRVFTMTNLGNGHIA
jgi:hypothetical protein